MDVLVIDIDPTERAMLLGRLQELKRLPELKAINPTPLLPKLIGERSFASTCAIILGPGIAAQPDETLQALAQKPRIPTASLFDPPAPHTVALSRSDDAALQGFLVKALANSQLARVAEARKIIGVAQLLGGTGATTLVGELGKAIALKSREEPKKISATLIDLDDVSPTLTSLGRVAPRHRAAVMDAVRRGTVTENDLSEILSPMPSWGKGVHIVPQPEQYAEAFHLKANVLEDAPVASLYINSLVSTLRSQDSSVVFDLGRSWGLSSFAALARCGQVILCVPGESPERVRLSIEFLKRLTRDSDSPEEFDLTKWQIALTRVPKEAIAPATALIRESELFNDTAQIIALPSPIVEPERYRQIVATLQND